VLFCRAPFIVWRSPSWAWWAEAHPTVLLSLPTTLQVLGSDTPAVLKQSLDAVASYQPLTPARRAEILTKSAARAADGSTERYKVSHHFDGTIQNPEWLG
jgi:hypothetical protein